MGQIEYALIVGVGMDRRHQAMAYAKILHDNLSHRSQTVGRTGGVGDDLVSAWIIVLFVDTQDDGQIWVLRWSRNDHAWSAGSEMFGRLVAVGEQSGGLDDQIG